MPEAKSSSRLALCFTDKVNRASKSNRFFWSTHTPFLCISTHITWVSWSTSLRFHGLSIGQESGLMLSLMGLKAPALVAAFIRGSVILAFTTVSMMLYLRSSSSSVLPVAILEPFSVVSHRSTSVRIDPIVFSPFGKSGALNRAGKSVSTSG